MRHTGLRFIVLATLVSTVAGGYFTSAWPQNAREYVVKAAFIYNFAKFVEWPAEVFRSAASPLTLCLIGEDPFAEALNTLADKTVQGRMLAIKRAIQLQDVPGCHIVFVGFSDASQMREFLKSMQRRPVLTISDVENFARTGGMINFFTEQNKIRFAINVEAVQRASLQISSKLLNLATIVTEQP